MIFSILSAPPKGDVSRIPRFGPMNVVLQIMGCRLNHAEGAAVRGALSELGHSVFSRGDAGAGSADAFVLHTCAVTGAAQTEALRLLRGARRAGLRDIVVSGCTANVETAVRLFDAGATAVVARGGVSFSENPPTEETRAVASAVESALNGAMRAVAESAPLHVTTRAPVKIQDGCSFRCSYCIVPDARGEPKSRPFDGVLGECRALLSRGFRELVLTGVNVACWHEGGRTFRDVVAAVSSLPGLARLRMSSVEPHTTERDVIAAITDPGSRLCRTLHLPLQSGSDSVLARMRRRYVSAEYRAVAEYALSRIPDLGLGADVITGFPGETDADYAATRDLIESLPFSNLHVFPYSERPGTPAAVMPGAVPVRVRRERARDLIALGERKRAEFAGTFVGRGVEVLVEKVSDDGVATGWTSQYLPCRISGSSREDVGELLSVTPTGTDGETLLASRIVRDA